jgi:hypothetical protein
MRFIVGLWLIAALAVPAIAKEFVAQPEDFRCLTDGAQPEGKRFHVFGKKRIVKRALRKTKTGKLGKGYPVGTILQLFPFEAMAKRGGKFNKEGNGWEYFKLKPNADGTTEILARGAADVLNFQSSSCQACHQRLAADHDSVCEFVVGPEGLGLTDDLIRALQTDVRCPPPQ